MLFLLKRTWAGGVAGLIVLSLLGTGLRHLLGTGPDIGLSLHTALLGLCVCALLLGSDAVLHGLFCWLLRQSYRRRYFELSALYHGQTGAAMLAGAALAGIGEELVFRGLSTSPAFLVAGAVLFGLLHHVRRSLWPFTLWAIYEGLLLAAALYVTGLLGVTMEAHFLHDLVGFAIFRRVNRGNTQ